MVKNKFPILNTPVTASLSVFLLLSILGTMLSTRAGLSLSMMLFGAVTLWHAPVREWGKHQWWLLGAAWVALYALSYFWSGDTEQWGRSVSVKMPIVLLPLAFALLPVLDSARLRVFIAGVLALLLAGVAFSVGHFLADPQAAIEGYGISHVLRTPLYNSHIHFSAAVACGVVFGAAAIPQFSGWQKKVLISVLILFVVYLHLLASKTGLVMIYLFFALLVLRTALRGRPLMAAGTLFVCALGLWTAVRVVPTLKKRAHYVAYTWQEMMDGRRDGLYSDLGRALSWEVAGRIALKHPVAGVGAGDLLHAMRTEYSATYPSVAPANHLIPHNQVLCAWLAAGLPGLVLFLVWLAAPLRWMRRHPQRFYARAMWCVLLVPLLVEPFLEVQAGVAVYLYFLLSGQYLLRCTDVATQNFGVRTAGQRRP